MPRTTTLTAAFDYLGARTHNVRQVWSALTTNGQTVVLTIWEQKKAADGSVDYFDPAGRFRWIARRGNRERKRHLRLALDHCNREVRGIQGIAQDANADTKMIKAKRIKDRIGDPATVMRITRFCEETGAVTARPV